ncbi:segregation/condensation protein A, partial [Selenomonas sp.]|uniref:segregation/condensation protein A n=1 Tax=Selenomonas sp. TaxID=2053611 RepID=UPI002A8DB1A1|nr:hypothetical protein [Selenomonas sp.]
YGMAVRVGEELAIPDALVTPDPMRVQDRMEEIAAALAKRPRVRFDETFRAGDVASLVTSFLALLELLRLGSIAVRQAGTYRDLMIERKTGKGGGPDGQAEPRGAGGNDARGNGVG